MDTYSTTDQSVKSMTTNRRTSVSNVCLVIVLYLVQGLNLGLAASMPILLGARGASWKDQGTLNFVFYPFSLKLIWAPLIDAIYSDRFGRRKSWLVPIQFGLAGIFLLLSFYIESFIATSRIILLTLMFFVIVFLTATQDICVDGLAISLFAATNPQWASTSQTLGQTVGRFLGFSFLLTFESANFTNQYIRAPLSLPPQTSGLISLEQFMRIVAVACLIVTMCLIVFFHEKKEEPIVKGEDTSRLSLYETYLSIWKLFQKKCILQLTLVSLLGPVGLVAVNYMTRVVLIAQGVPQANLALVNIPTSLVSIIAPLIIRHTERPLTWFARSYVLCLISAIPIAAYVYFTPRMISSSYYYPLLILFLGCGEFVVVLRFAAQVGFYASISEPRIGGTYMTLLVTLNNLGFALNSSLVLYVSAWLPKKYAYVIAVSVGVLLGALWLGLSARTIKRLQNLPTEKWYLMPERNIDDVTVLKQQDENDHEESLISNKKVDHDA